MPRKPRCRHRKQEHVIPSLLAKVNFPCQNFKVCTLSGFARGFYTLKIIHNNLILQKKREPRMVRKRVKRGVHKRPNLHVS